MKTDFQLMTLKEISQLPKHITYEEYNKLLDKIKNKKHKLFFYLLWITGGRVTDICNLKVEDFNFETKILDLRIKKTKKTESITLTDRDCFEVKDYLHIKKIDKGLIFNFTRQNAWKLLRQYSRLIGHPKLHPHMFRHGLAIYLLNNNVPIPIISARLGHSNTTITMNMYLKVTPEVQRLHLKDIKMRDD